MSGRLERATVLVGATPFGDGAVRLLEAAGCRVLANPHGRKLEADELRALLPAADAWIAGSELVTRELLAAAPRLRFIARSGVGLDAIDLEAARERGIGVAYTPEATTGSVAELTIGLMIDLARHVSRADRAIRAGRWERHVGFLLEGRTLGVLGCGRIGKRVARLARALGMRVLARDIAPDKAWAESLEVTYVKLRELLEASDVVTVHLPLAPGTRGILGPRELEAIRPGALLVNTSRGEVLDEDALLAALRSGRLAGAALDVFAREPYSGPLAALENVVLTAHMGSCSREGRLAMELGAARAVVAFLDGREVANRVV